LTRIFLILAAFAALGSSQAQAWGDLGHEVTALVAYRHLSPTARAALDAMLASDTDPLTPKDFAGRATWADKYRNAHRETAAWHFVDIEIDQPNLEDACFGFPTLPTGQFASAGPAQDCVVNKIDEFTVELKSPSTPPAERLLALKFLIHFIGDLHQPLHAAAQIAEQLDARLSADEIKDWSRGTPRSWAMDTFEVGRHDVYALPSTPTCQSGGSVSLSPAYQQQAQKDAITQLLKAAVRLAAVLNGTLGP
jgi:S1/P1 Nuclease